MSLLGVDESKYTADMFLWWELNYEDDASVAAIQANYSDQGCNLYCNVRMSTVLNEVGQPACCDDVFIPQVCSCTIPRSAVLPGLPSPQSLPWSHAGAGDQLPRLFCARLR